MWVLFNNLFISAGYNKGTNRREGECTMQMFHLAGFPPYYTNSFLLITEAGNAVIIDPSCEPVEYNRILGEHGAKLTHILLTHGHFDHVPGAEELRRQWGAALYLDKADAQGTQRLPISKVDGEYTDGGELKVDELTFRTWYTPGHTLGSWCLLCGNLFFTGDTLFHGSIGRTDFAESDPEKMKASLEKLKALPLADDVQVLPGHMDASTMGEEKRYNPYMRGYAWN